jgi:hypothetical protein
LFITGKNNTPEVTEKHGANGYAKTLGTVVDEAILLLRLLVEGKGDKKVGR